MTVVLMMTPVLTAGTQVTYFIQLSNQSHHSLCLTHFLVTINTCKYSDCHAPASQDQAHPEGFSPVGPDRHVLGSYGLLN